MAAMDRGSRGQGGEQLGFELLLPSAPAVAHAGLRHDDRPPSPAAPRA
jgi:hypothetical protein